MNRKKKSYTAFSLDKIEYDIFVQRQIFKEMNTRNCRKKCQVVEMIWWIDSRKDRGDDEIAKEVEEEEK